MGAAQYLLSRRGQRLVAATQAQGGFCMELSLYPILHPGSDHVAKHTAHVWAHTKSASQRVVGGRFSGGEQRQ